MFRESYNFDAPPGEFINIDAFIPGCPPKPEAIISAVVTVIGALRAGELVPGCATQSPDRRSTAKTAD